MTSNSSIKNEQTLSEGGRAERIVEDHLETVVKGVFPFSTLSKEGVGPLNTAFNFVENFTLFRVKEAVGDNAFGKFFVLLGLYETDGGRDWCIFFDDLVEDEDGEELDQNSIAIKLIAKIIDYVDEKSIEFLTELNDFLMTSKEVIINDFVIPHYKVYKTSHIWLEEQTESAFNKAVRKKFGKHFGFWSDIFDDFRESLTVGDHVSIFEYFLDGQDRQTLSEDY